MFDWILNTPSVMISYIHIKASNTARPIALQDNYKIIFLNKYVCCQSMLP